MALVRGWSLRRPGATTLTVPCGLRRAYQCAAAVRSLLLVCVATFALAACGTKPVSRTAVPQAVALAAEPVGFPGVRVWGDVRPPNIEAIAEQGVRQLRAARPALFRPGATASFAFLALSGGGADGAFGAGLLYGWSERGTRPEFQIVTGISTGALIAPFAFLGPRYDEAMREVYTQFATADLVDQQFLAALFGGVSVADTSKLRALVERYITHDVMGEIAVQWRRGRRLLIGTTNLDAQRPVIWSIGAIAQRGDEAALKLIHDILLASAAIPGVFPPTFLEVEVDGQVFQEMHVDGGTTEQVFFVPGQLDLTKVDAKYGLRAQRTLYVIRNSKIAPEYDEVKPTTVAIAGRSVSTLIKFQGLGDLRRLYNNARSNGFAFNLAAIPVSFEATPKEPFDKVYMNELFEYARKLARDGYRWSAVPQSEELQALKRPLRIVESRIQ